MNHQHPKLPHDLPKTKSDIDAVKALSILSFSELEAYLPELLEWIQDVNWPLSSFVTELIRSHGGPVVPSVKIALSKAKMSEDAIWAQNIIELIIKPLGREQIILFNSEFRSWWFSDNTEIKLLIFGLMAENKIGDQEELKKWVTINRKAFEIHLEDLKHIESQLDQNFIK